MVFWQNRLHSLNKITQALDCQGVISGFLPSTLRASDAVPDRSRRSGRDICPICFAGFSQKFHSLHTILGFMQFRIVIVGDELLSGKRRDKHMSFVIEALSKRGLKLAEVRIVGDEPELLTQTFKETLASGAAVFSFGGIGATPDDITRQCFATALGVALEPHKEFVTILENKFGQQAYPNRIHLTEFPEGSTLIPNPVNQMAGFSLREHHFVPGFPNMAHPMIEWVLDHYYQAFFQAEADAEYLIKVENTPESELIPLLENVLETNPEIRIASLPSTQNRGEVELGVKGKKESVLIAAKQLKNALKNSNIKFTEYAD